MPTSHTKVGGDEQTSTITTQLIHLYVSWGGGGGGGTTFVDAPTSIRIMVYHDSYVVMD
jgi:hypothetical protein